MAALWAGTKVAAPIVAGIMPFLGGGKTKAQQLAIQQRNQAMAKWYQQNTKFANAQAALGIAANARVQGYSRRLGDIERSIKTKVGLTFAEQQSILGRYAAKHGSGAVGVSKGSWAVSRTAGKGAKAAELLGKMAASDATLAKLGEQTALLTTSALREFQSKVKYNNQALPTYSVGPYPEGEGFISKAVKGLSAAASMSEGLSQIQDFATDGFGDLKKALGINKKVTWNAGTDLGLGLDKSKFDFNLPEGYWQ